MTRILVTGVSGQVGHALIERLRPFGEVVTSAEPGQPSDLPLDLADPAAIAELVRKVAPTVIVNPAAYTAVDKAEDEPELAMRINAEAAGALAGAAASIGAPIVHYSTDYVYSDSGTAPLDESTPVAPLSVYGRSKAEGDRLVAERAPRHVILRTSWVFSDRGNNFVRTMLRLGAERPALRVVADQFGAPTSAAFLADLTARVVQRLLGDGGAPPSGVYHLTCAGATSWHGFAEEIFRQARALGLPLKIENVEPIATADYPTRAQRPTNSRLDCSRFFRTFGGEHLTWEQALARVLPNLVPPAP